MRFAHLCTETTEKKRGCESQVVGRIVHGGNQEALMDCT